MSNPALARVSLIVPCFNEAEGIEHCLVRLTALTREHDEYDFEFLFVDDGSQDLTESLLVAQAAQDPRVKVVALARNFGHQRAITAGLDHCTGDYVIILDADLQDPPELIPEILRLLSEGYDVVHTVRADRSVDPLAKRFSAWAFYALMRRWVLPELPVNAGDFKGFNRRVLRALQRYREHVRFLRGSIATLGFQQTEIAFVRAGRHAGQSKYALRNMLRLARDAVFSNTALPLRIALYLGLIVLCVGVPLYAAGMAWLYAAGQLGEPLAALVGLIVMIFGGLNLCFFGMAGEYLKVIVLEVKDRPLYIVRSLHNLDGVSVEDAP